jgi:DNA-binding MarR family transcriptional regulator
VAGVVHLGIFGQMTARDISMRAKIHKTKISRAVQKLVDRRFVKRERSLEDRRQEQLELTPTGRSAYLDLRQTAYHYQTMLSADFSQAELALLQRMLLRLAN